jgi:cobalt-zinc-cadmium efflux system outer membrane protein
LELPVFNQGAGKLAHAKALLEQAQSTLESLQLAIANNIRLQTQRAAAARARAEQLRTQLIPAREEVVKRTQQEVSYMLEGQFRLLEVKQQEYEAYQTYIEAVRDYWVAQAELGREVGTRLPATASDPTPPDPHSGSKQAPLEATTPSSQAPAVVDMPGMDMPKESPTNAPASTSRPDTVPPTAGEHTHPGGAQ